MFGMVGAVPAFADAGPHKMGAGVLADGCAGCHRVHTAKTDMLTMEAQPQLCYTCHGGTGTGADTNVKDGVARGAAPGALRGGGFEYALIDSANPTGQDGVLPAGPKNVPALNVSAAGTAAVATTSNHSVTGADAIAWGNGPISATPNVGKTVQLRCGSCHDPHGNGNYRILRPMPQQGTTNLGTANPIVPFTGIIADSPVVVGAPEEGRVYTTTNYWDTNDATSSGPTGYVANVSQWCSQCHTRYLATRDSGVTRPTDGTPPQPKPFVTTPDQRSRADSGDATFMYRHTSSQTNAGGRNCITCHVSHGSNASMGTFSGAVGNPGGTANLDGTSTVGDSKLLRIDNRGTCKMCHEEGG